jgi:tRNA1Val (adenine37-N6)-methyltransferase
MTSATQQTVFFQQPDSGLHMDTQLDRLSGDYVIYQPVEGQRYTTDDMLVAWLAVRELQADQSNVSSFLDLGCGLCSVSMIILWCCKNLHGIGIEHAASRLDCARLSLTANQLTNRFQLINGDLRDLCLKTRFDFITSSPPYYEYREGPLSPDPDRARVRFETQGSIEAYFQTAAAHAAPGARFITVYPTAYKQRVDAAASASGFSIQRSIDIIPRAGKAALFTLFTCVNNASEALINEELTVRGLDQLFTTEFRAVRRMLGFRDKAK